MAWSELYSGGQADSRNIVFACRIGSAAYWHYSAPGPYPCNGITPKCEPAIASKSRVWEQSDLSATKWLVNSCTFIPCTLRYLSLILAGVCPYLLILLDLFITPYVSRTLQSRLGTGKTITFYYSADPLDYSEKICHLIRVFYTFGFGNPFLNLASETQWRSSAFAPFWAPLPTQFVT